MKLWLETLKTNRSNITNPNGDGNHDDTMPFLD